MITALLILIALAVFVVTFVALSDSSGESSGSSSGTVSISKVEDLDELVNRAQQAEKNNDWSTALRAWSRYLELEPNSYDVMFKRGYAHFKNSDFELAIEDLEQVLEELDDPPTGIHRFLAKCWAELNQNQRAMGHFQDYVDQNPDDLNFAFEAAQFARENDLHKQAQKLYRRTRDRCEEGSAQYIQSIMELVETALEMGNAQTARQYLSDLKEYRQLGELTNDQELQYLYIMARLQEMTGNQSDAQRLYRKIYDRNPDYRDVESIVQEQIDQMSDDEKIKKFLKLPRDDFVALAEKVVQEMEYEPMKTSVNTPEEVDIHARERADMLKVNRIVVAFKQWKETIGEMPVKDFELKVIENRFDEGFLVCPGGFTRSAEEYSEKSPSLNLVGPEKLLSYLPDADEFVFH